MVCKRFLWCCGHAQPGPSAGLALGYVAARLVEAMFIAIGIISLLTFVFMRQEGTARANPFYLIVKGFRRDLLADFLRTS